VCAHSNSASNKLCHVLSERFSIRRLYSLLRKMCLMSVRAFALSLGAEDFTLPLDTSDLLQRSVHKGRESLTKRVKQTNVTVSHPGFVGSMKWSSTGDVKQSTD